MIYLGVLHQWPVWLEDDQAAVHVLQQVELTLQDRVGPGVTGCAVLRHADRQRHPTLVPLECCVGSGHL